jgi:hypothetical protein
MSALKNLFVVAIHFLAFAAGVLHWSDAQATEKQPAEASTAKDSPAGFSEFAYLPLVTAQERLYPPDCLFLEQDGVIVMEVESGPFDHPDWRLENDVPTDYVSEGYMVWRGIEYLGTPGIAPAAFPLRVTNPGEYRLQILNWHQAPQNDQENDVWVRMDGGSWVKVFSPFSGIWSWPVVIDYGNHNFAEPVFFLGAGDHVLELSARSKGFRMDRMDLHLPGAPGMDLSRPESQCVAP